MIKIASEWNEQSSSTIKIYSNCETITLLHDDKPLNIKPVENNRFSANLKFPPKEFILSHPGKGQLKAVGYINGKKAAEDVVNPYGAPAGLYLAWDESCKTIGTNDLVFIYAWVVDKSGNKNKVATNKVSFSVEGAGTLVGENPINCEAGVAGILLKTGDIGGKIILRATSDGLDPGFLIINVE
jgi:beta-galactosidase